VTALAESLRASLDLSEAAAVLCSVRATLGVYFVTQKPVYHPTAQAWIVTMNSLN
jgi:hypothetical protein